MFNQIFFSHQAFHLFQLLKDNFSNEKILTYLDKLKEEMSSERKNKDFETILEEINI